MTQHEKWAEMLSKYCDWSADELLDTGKVYNVSGLIDETEDYQAGHLVSLDWMIMHYYNLLALPGMTKENLDLFFSKDCSFKLDEEIFRQLTD